MRSAKSLKSIAIDNPRRVGKPENLRAAKHHLSTSSGKEQAFAADAIVKLAYADPHSAQQIRATLEQVDEEPHQREVKERVARALTHIDSQIDTSSSPPADRIGYGTEPSDEDTQIYRTEQTQTDPNYCPACGIELPDTGPANFCPGCGADVRR